MDTVLDLHDIQGNLVKAYGRYGYPKARYIFYSVLDGVKGRKFIKELISLVTTAAPWSAPGSTIGHTRPSATTNIAFTYEGLKHLGVPRQSLQSFPDEFVMGMKARKDILGDDGPSAPENWDPIWCYAEPVHIWISINGQSEEKIAQRYKEINALVEQSQEGIKLLRGHRGENNADDLAYQQASAIYIDGVPSATEHFGYTDGISNPFFKGTGANPANVIGGGKPTLDEATTVAGWEALETGEFILGHRDEAFEYPTAPMPPLLARNGTFMVYRKLHENVGCFNKYLDEVGKNFEGGKEALAAKFSGRWRNGAPITTFPTENEANEFIEQVGAARAKWKETASEQDHIKYLELRKKYAAFDYNQDLQGSRCPVGAHTRRANPRGALEFGVTKAYNTPGALVNRRRILRRGLPYGEVNDATRDDGNHGIIFMAINADIKRQFEFVQQQWINYGNDFKLSNDKDPILGNQGVDTENKANGRMIVEADTDGTKPPFFCAHIPRFVEVRGGDYFFIPSMSALRMLAEGIIDPT